MDDDIDPKPSPALALMLGFAPTVIVLLLVMISTTGAGNSLPNWKSLPIVLCGICAFCCFTSSFLLFQRRTAMAIVGGLLLMLINGCIAFFFGCVAFIGGI